MIIAISGQAGSGKDTCADIIVNDFNFCKIALADPIKRFCKEIFNFSEQQLWGDSKYRNEKNNGLTSRYALQSIGTTGRDCYKNVWIDYTINIAKKLLTNNFSYSPQLGLLSKNNKSIKGVIISDVRFKNELKIIKDNGGITIRVLREKSGLKGKIANHQSETEMKEIPNEDFDYIIVNDGTIEELKEKIYNIIKTHV